MWIQRSTIRIHISGQQTAWIRRCLWATPQIWSKLVITTIYWCSKWQGYTAKASTDYLRGQPYDLQRRAIRISPQSQQTPEHRPPKLAIQRSRRPRSNDNSNRPVTDGCNPFISGKKWNRNVWTQWVRQTLDIESKQKEINRHGNANASSKCRMHPKGACTATLFNARSTRASLGRSTLQLQTTRQHKWMLS